jgi:adenine-specific DNA-methyltransferase
MAKKETTKTVETLTHEAKRKNIPTVEYQPLMVKEDAEAIRVAYERRNRDIDPQLVWRGKDDHDWSDLVVQAPPLYIQEKVHPKVLIDDLLRRTQETERDSAPQTDLFADFNGIPDGDAKTEFYQHDSNWTNRMILGDSLQVMASLAEREGLRGKVQCIYLDPPYGIKFNSNFQWSTTSRDVKDGNVGHITREPEQVKAFRDTWRDGIHSYLTYLRDRLTVARDLLHDSGSIFVQIGDENYHLITSLLDEVFGSENRISLIPFVTTGGQSSSDIGNIFNYLVWYAKDRSTIKYRQLYQEKELREGGGWAHSRAEFADKSRRNIGVAEVRKRIEDGEYIRPYSLDGITSQGSTISGSADFFVEGRRFKCGHDAHWKTSTDGMRRLLFSSRIECSTNSIRYVRFLDDFSIQPITNLWADTNRPGYIDAKTYVVQTSAKVIERCLLMVTDPGDLVLDPTCGSGTTAYVAEQWGRRWITIDTSRVALALARARIMGARYSFYLLADSREGQMKEAEVSRTAPSSQPTRGDIRYGFVYERVPHITLKSIANNAEIDVIWEKWQKTLEPLRQKLNAALKKSWEEWEIPRDAVDTWTDTAKKLHTDWWNARIARQQEIDASIAAKAEYEYLYDKPYLDNKKVRVAGPFTVESLSPHRVLTVDEDDDLIDGTVKPYTAQGDEEDFVRMILENLKTSGVQQAHKEDRIVFSSLTPWPGYLVCAEGRFVEVVGSGVVDSGVVDSGVVGSGSTHQPPTTNHQLATTSEKRAAIFIGPEFGTVSRPDLVSAAREAADADFDVLITCAFNYDAQSSEFKKLGRIPVLKARMNADLHMADDLKNTGKGNLFVIFGEPDIEIIIEADNTIRVKIKGVDVFHPTTGEVRSDHTDGIACWFIDTDYNEESFFVRQAYFLGANDPYKSLKTTLKAEINQEAWETLHSDTSRAFAKPTSGRIAVKVINHLGDEVMKVFRVN